MNVNIITIIFGLFAGVFVGMLGTPGYALIVPGLLFLSIIPQYSKAVGTYLLMAAIPLTLAAAFIYYKNNLVDLQISFILMGSVLLGSIGGAYLSPHISDLVKQRIAGTIESIIGPYYLLRGFQFIK
jgi:uncharacterized membrane protein YfcA